MNIKIADKRFIDANELHKKSILLASKILESGFRPDYIIALWRGGSPVGIYVQEFFKYSGVDSAHSPLKVSLYKEKFIGKQEKKVQVEALNNLVGSIFLNEDIKSILILDDVFDSGRTISKVKKSFRNYDVRVGVTYYKVGNNVTDVVPDYCAEKVPGETWLVFAHELMDLKKSELGLKNEWISKLISETKKNMTQ